VPLTLNRAAYIAEITADVPREEFAKLPKDGARQIDHYLCGLPKGD
jgi:hypothetical protein